MAKTNCAIYVRKSTEKGLELEFNSLQNQEEACKNYILSQSFNNWEHYKTYVDGGISGGTMERPALQEMLHDMEHGLIQIVVVYKVDRLSRSIIDFHNMMKIFEKYNCSFVSITQAFDTSNSMGKLTLNMLLSFAQFEREVSSERVRDKIQASKAKGMWTGGMMRLGYDSVDKKLVVNMQEAKIVRYIFESYLECSSILELMNRLRNENIKSKMWTASNGKIKGGCKLTGGMINRILNDKTYLGEVEHKRIKEIFKGQHEAIIDLDLWNKVQQKLKENNNRNNSNCKASSNILSGKVFDNNGVKFTNQLTSKIGKIKLRYYAKKGLYLPADQLEQIIKNAISEILDADFSKIDDYIKLTLKQINFANMDCENRKNFIKNFINKVIYNNEKVQIFFNINIDDLQQFKDKNFINQNNKICNFIFDKSTNQIVIEYAFVINNTRLTNNYYGKLMTVNDNNKLIVRAVAYAWKYREMFERGMGVKEIAKTECISPRTLYRYLGVAYLSPKIINNLMSGKLQISIKNLIDNSEKYSTFSEQEKIFFQNSAI